MKTKLNHGFTLVEITLATALLALVLTFIFLFMRYWLGAFFENQNRSQAQDDAFRLLNALVTQLREMETGETGQYALEITGDQEIGYYADYDSDRRIERVRYYLSGESLYRGIVEPVGDPGTYDLTTETINQVGSEIVNGTEPVFYYYNDDWPQDTINNPLSTGRLLQTSLVEVRLKVRSPDLDIDKVVAASGSAHLRTLKTNYQTNSPTPTP